MFDGESYLQIFREIEFSFYYHKLSGFKKVASLAIVADIVW